MKTFVATVLIIGCIIAAAGPTEARTRFTRQTQNVADCIRRCPTATSEYNPVCGNNGMTYDNPSKLACAQNNCGVAVTMNRRGNCDGF